MAAVLAVLAYGTPSFSDSRPSLSPRGGQTWRSETILFITQEGFPWGRAVPQYRPSIKGTPAVPIGDQDRLAGLAALYAQLAGSDFVRRIATQSGPLRAEISTEPVTYVSTQFSFPQILPLIKITSTASDPSVARRGAVRISKAFRTYVRGQQGQARIPAGDRVLVSVAKRPQDADLLIARSKILPIVVFVAVLALVFGLVLVLDNLARGSRVRRSRPAQAPEQRPGTAASPRVASRSVPHQVRRQTGS